LNFVIKCLIHWLMKIYYHDYLFSISILDKYLSPHDVQKGYTGKTSVGETHRDNETKFDRKIHEILKVINQGSCMMKQAPSSHYSGSPSLLLGRLAHHSTTMPPICPWSGLSPIHSIFICFASYFKQNWKWQGKTTLNIRKDYFTHDLG
jgi:hypothetical protein